MERGNARLKLIDKILGPLLLFVMTPLRWIRKGAVPAVIDSVGILKTAAIGDTVLVSAIVSDLRQTYPKARITLFAGSSNFEFSKLLFGVDEVVELPLSNPIKCLRLIRRNEFDVFFDFDPWPRISALLTALSRSTVRVGFRTAGQHRHYMYDMTVTHRSDIHELMNYRSLAETIGLAGKSLPQDLHYPWKPERQQIVFHLWPSGTQSHLKEWPWGNWQRLARELLKKGDFKFALTGGKPDRERVDKLLKAVDADLADRFENKAGATIAETLSLLQQASLLISVNTGIMHVGAAMGVPTVGLHGPTDPKRWGPIGLRTKSVLSKSERAGTLNLGFEYMPDVDYMSGLSVESVEAAARELLDR